MIRYDAIFLVVILFLFLEGGYSSSVPAVSEIQKAEAFEIDTEKIDQNTTSFLSEESGTDKEISARNVPLSDSDKQTLVKMEKILVKKDHFPWYSRQTRDLKFLPPPQERTNSDYYYERDTTTSRNFSLMSTVLYFILIVFVLIVGILLWFVFEQYYKKYKDFEIAKKEPDNRKRQRENLPLEVHESLDNLYTMAERYYREGDYRRAIIFYFSYILVEMDKAQLIRLNKGRTNRDYLPALCNQEELRKVYRTVMELFEKTYYGTWRINQNDFERVWAERELFQDLLQRIQNERNGLTKGVRIIVPIPKIVLLLLFPSLLFCFSGCAKKWNDKYTEYTPANLVITRDESINGYYLFQKMAESKGFEVYNNNNPMLDLLYTKDMDAIIWFHNVKDIFSLIPKANEVDIYKKWLKEKSGRTLIIVCNGYLADVPFWEKMVSKAPKEHETWANLQLIAARQKEIDYLNDFSTILDNGNIMGNIQQKSSIKNDISENYDSNNCPAEWNAVKNDMKVIMRQCHEPLFHLFPIEKVRIETHLSGETYWTEGIEVTQPFRFLSRLKPSKETKTVLSVGDCPLICYRSAEEGQFYILQSASILLNYPIMEKQNQILASRLLDRIGSGKKKILFFDGSLLYYHQQEKVVNNSKTPFFFTTSPFSILFWHLLLLTFLVTLWMFPIFGRPKELPREMKAEFGRHLTAYGDMVARTKKRAWVIRQIEKFLENYRKE